MNSKIIFLLATIITVRSSFLQTPDHFQATFNSTFLKKSAKLLQPVIIPNATKSTEQPKAQDVLKARGNETSVRKVHNPKEISQESSIGENLDEKLKTTGNSPKFSSRYSTKPEVWEELLKEGNDEVNKKTGTENATTDTSNHEKKSGPVEKERSFSDRSDDLDDSEEKDDIFRLDEPREAEHSEIASTTNEPYAELRRPTSFRSSPYVDDDLENYETTSISAEEIDSSEEKEEEESKRSLGDYYYNSGTKNYHSIQTPLNEVKYRGPQVGRFESEKSRSRYVRPFNRHYEKPDWSYSRPTIEELNEISENDEIYEKDFDEDLKEEVKTKQNYPDLEKAVEKDEFKFDRNEKYNHIDDRKHRKQQEKNLAAEEEKDDVPLFQNLKEYQVDKEPRQPTGGEKLKIKEDIWYGKPVISTPKSLFTAKSSRKPLGGNNEPNFLGPITFNPKLDQKKTNQVVKHSQRVPIRSSYLRDLLENEKLDQDNLTEHRSEKSTFGSLGTRSFNHLQENDEMYSAILANIQSVFGIKAQSLKSNGQKGSIPEGNLEESKSLTWSSPLIKSTKVN